MLDWNGRNAKDKEFEYEFDGEYKLIERNINRGMRREIKVNKFNYAAVAEKISHNRQAPMLEITNYIKKVIRQAYESETMKPFDENVVNIFIMIVDNSVMINWRIDEYEPKAHRIPVRVRYRLQRNFSVYFDYEAEVFTRNTIIYDEFFKDRIEHCYSITVPDGTDFSYMSSLMGVDLFNKIQDKIYVKDVYSCD